MTIGKLIKTVRKAQGVNQDVLAKAVGVSQQAFSQFEKGEGGIAISKLSKIAPLLQLNEKYFAGQASNPFYSQRLIKILLFPTSKSNPITDYSLLYLLCAVNHRLFFYSLSIQEPLAGKVTLESLAKSEPVYAFLVRDVDRNMFLFRRKEKNPVSSEILGFEQFEKKTEEMATREKKVLKFWGYILEEKLQHKIRNWTVEKDDLTNFLGEEIINPGGLSHPPSEDERELIYAVREMKIRPKEATEILRKWVDSHKSDL